jgi:hypothetical protein
MTIEVPRMGRGLAILLVVGALPAPAQQINDSSFQFHNPNPAFAPGHGPRVCIDEAHNNSHTLSQLYAPFAEVLRSDGFRPRAFTEAISIEGLSECEILLLGSGRATKPGASEFWAYPHASAYSRAEIDALIRWVRGGGSILLIWDHSPATGAAAGIAAVFGVQTLDAWADATPQGNYPEIIRRSDQLVADHPIVRGRSPHERIDSLATHGSGAFFPSTAVEPVLLFGEGATAWIRLGDMGQGISSIPEEDWPAFSIRGWLLAGARRWGSGRVVFFGDSTACTAQLYGATRTPLAMSHPAGVQNALFCLNMVRWLADKL